MLIPADIIYAWGMILLVRVGPIAAVGVGAYYLFKRSALGQAILARPDGATQEVLELRSVVEELREQMAELQERVDFSERALAQLGPQPLVAPSPLGPPTPPAPVAAG